MKLQNINASFLKITFLSAGKISRFRQVKSNKNWHGLTVATDAILWTSCYYLVVCLDGQMIYVSFVYDVYV